MGITGRVRGVTGQVRGLVGTVLSLAFLLAVAVVLVYLGYFTAPTAGSVCVESPETDWDGLERTDEPAELDVSHSVVWIDATVRLRVEGTDVDHTWHHGLTPEDDSEMPVPDGEFVGKRYVVTVTDNGRTATSTGTIGECDD